MYAESPLPSSSHPRDSSMRTSITLRIRVTRTHTPSQLPSLSHYRRQPARRFTLLYTISLPSPTLGPFTLVTNSYFHFAVPRTVKRATKLSSLLCRPFCLQAPFNSILSYFPSRSLVLPCQDCRHSLSVYTFHLIVRPRHTRGPLAPQTYKHHVHSYRENRNRLSPISEPVQTLSKRLTYFSLCLN